MSIGFAPNVEDFGLENTGVKLTDRGAIEIDDFMHTSVPHIYAIGDVTAKLQLAHVAEAQGVVAAETIGKAETMALGDYRMMPRATFCSPQVASFGLTEQQARDAGYDVKVAKFPFSANGKANGLGEPIGFVKLIADGEHLELLGGHLIGPDVSELLPELTLAQKWDLTALEAARNVHTHPTLSEAVQEAFHGLAGHMINLLGRPGEPVAGGPFLRRCPPGADGCLSAEALSTAGGGVDLEIQRRCRNGDGSRGHPEGPARRGARLGEALGNAGVNIEGLCAIMEGRNGHRPCPRRARHGRQGGARGRRRRRGGDRRYRQSTTTPTRRRRARKVG